MNRIFRRSLRALFGAMLAHGFACGALRYDFVISSDQEIVDGAALGVASGDVIGIEAGERGRIAFVNIHGSAEKPVIIVNKGGKVSLSSGAADEAILITKSSHFQLRGDGDPSIGYGFEVARATGTGVQIRDRSTDFAVCFLRVHDCGYAGIMSKTDPACGGANNRGGFTQRNVAFHDNYVHDVRGEGFYLGSSFHTGKRERCGVIFPHDIVGMRVYNNRAERTGREGIQVGCVVSDCEIYGNTIHQAGTRNEEGQNNGVQINPGTTGTFHHNAIVDAPGNGVTLTGLGNNAAYSNVIVNVGGHGFFCDDRNNADDPRIGTIQGSFIRVHDNVIVNAGRFAFCTYNERSVHEFRNNVVINAASGLVDHPNATLAESNNLQRATAK